MRPSRIERLAQTVDHVVPMRVAPERRLELSNLQPLCFACYDLMRTFVGRIRASGDKRGGAPSSADLSFGPWRQIREGGRFAKNAPNPSAHDEMRDDGIVQPSKGQVPEHRHLDHGHDLGGIRAEQRRSTTVAEPFRTQRGRFCFDARHGFHATGKHAETIRHILDPDWHSSFSPNRYISRESTVAHPELLRRTVVILMEPARSA